MTSIPAWLNAAIDAHGVLPEEPSPIAEIVVERIFAPIPIGWKVRVHHGRGIRRAVVMGDQSLRATLNGAGWELTDHVAGWAARPRRPVVIPASDPTSVERVAQLLNAGHLCAVPTDTVYGVVAPLSDPRASARLASLKGRDPQRPFQVLVADLEQARSLAQLDAVAVAALDSLWPGGLTAVAPRVEGFDANLGGPSHTVGLRCPANELCRQLIEQCGPLVASSANPSGANPATTAVRVQEAFGDALAAVIDGGELDNEPSTVIDIASAAPTVLREGSVALSTISAAWAAAID